MSYTFSLSRRSLPVRCLCLLLAVLVLWCFFMVPRAGAVATEAATVAYAGALIGTILVGAGVVFSSHGDMQAVGAAMYKSWIKSSNAIGSTISAIASWALEHGEAVAKGALRVGKDMYQTIVDAFNASYSDGSFVAPSVSVLLKYSSFNDDWYTFFRDARYTSAQIVADGKLVCSLSVSLIGTVWTYKFSGLPATSSDVPSYVSKGYIHPCVMLVRYGDGSISLHPRLYDDNGDFYKGGGSGDIANFEKQTVVANLGHAVAVPQPDLKYPSDDYLVRMPDIPSVDTATGDVSYPNDTAYTKDAVSIPYPTDADGVKVPDIPFDKVVDQSSGKALDDADTGTDTKPGEGAGTETGSGVSGLIGTIIGLLKNFFDSPSDFKLDMDGFRNLAIADKFPFCIPFDMVDSVKQFAATAADYQFRIKFDTQYFSVDHTVDLAPIAVPLAFFRYIVCVWFVWVLMSRTHDLMKW